MIPQLATATLNILLPPRCASCGVMVRQQGGLCGACWKQVNLIAAPHCGRCGAPQAYHQLGEHGCDLCPPDHLLHRGRSAFVYHGVGRALVLGFKHADRTEQVRLLSRWMVAAGRDLWPEAEMIVPVPLHWQRMFTRRYNQAALLARQIGQVTGIPVDLGAVRRTRATLPQQGSARQRQQNLHACFAVPDPAQIKGKSVVVIDDVWTTGATLGAVADVLRQAGARTVSAVTAARVVKNSVDNSVESGFCP